MNKNNRQLGFTQRVAMAVGNNKIGARVFFKEFYSMLKQFKGALKIIIEHWSKTHTL